MNERLTKQERDKARALCAAVPRGPWRWCGNAKTAARIIEESGSLVTRLLDEVSALEAERDALRARLAELEGVVR